MVFIDIIIVILCVYIDPVRNVNHIDSLTFNWLLVCKTPNYNKICQYVTSRNRCVRQRWCGEGEGDVNVKRACVWGGWGGWHSWIIIVISHQMKKGSQSQTMNANQLHFNNQRSVWMNVYSCKSVHSLLTFSKDEQTESRK